MRLLEKGSSEIKKYQLTPGFITDFLYYFRKSRKNENSTPGEKISLAIAFANLYLADPGDVTDHHTKMLAREFKSEEIEELIALIKKELMD